MKLWENDLEPENSISWKSEYIIPPWWIMGRLSSWWRILLNMDTQRITNRVRFFFTVDEFFEWTAWNNNRSKNSSAKNILYFVGDLFIWRNIFHMEKQTFIWRNIFPSPKCKPHFKWVFLLNVVKRKKWEKSRLFNFF